MKVIEK